MLNILSHVNCSYLSTPGVPPTLLQLKQHAQSLIILIKHISVSTRGAIVDNAGTVVEGVPPEDTAADPATTAVQRLPLPPGFRDGESFDFLNDLTRPYQAPHNTFYHHNLPLTSLANVLEHATQAVPALDGQGHHHGQVQEVVRDICPLHMNEQAPVNGHSLPYATHQTLISHANEVLELLDHEYSAKGGLLSILPTKDEKEDRAKAETTLLGQMILYTQRLVQRLHDLECLYANSMDVIAGEAVVPHQNLSRLGPDGRIGREIVYPQDRFVLVNAGEDVWSFLDREFNNKERVDEAVALNYRKLGVTGEKIWEQRGGKEMSKGITCIDVVTRYFRLRGDNLKTIFIVPAHAEHPGTKVTREMERQPTVVSVVKPVWPERASMWEMKHRSDMDELKRTRGEHAQLTREKEWLGDEKTVLQEGYNSAQGRVMELETEITRLNNALAEDVNVLRAQFQSEVTATHVMREENEKLQVRLERELAAAKRTKDDAERRASEVETARRTAMVAVEKLREDEVARWKKRKEDQDTRDLSIGRAAATVADEMRARWKVQLDETKILLEWLRQKKTDVSNMPVPNPPATGTTGSTGGAGA
jgi:hypothetical protein